MLHKYSFTQICYGPNKNIFYVFNRDDSKTSTFTPFSVILGSTIKEIHRCLLQAMISEEYPITLTQLIKVWQRFLFIQGKVWQRFLFCQCKVWQRFLFIQVRYGRGFSLFRVRYSRGFCLFRVRYGRGFCLFR